MREETGVRAREGGEARGVYYCCRRGRELRCILAKMRRRSSRRAHQGEREARFCIAAGARRRPP